MAIHDKMWWLDDPQWQMVGNERGKKSLLEMSFLCEALEDNYEEGGLGERLK